MQILYLIVDCLSEEESLSCHTCCDFGSWILWPNRKDRISSFYPTEHNAEWTLKQRLNLNSTLIQRLLDIVRLMGKDKKYWGLDVIEW
jgi:hypothetical protein